ncbi:MAG: VOC family protein [Gemmatimonadales bacterium]
MCPSVDAGSGLGPIGQIAVNAKDVPRAMAFYRDVLGLPFLFEAPGLAFFQCGPTRLMLTRADTPEFDHPSSILYFTVSGIEESHRALAARGVTFVESPKVVHRTPDMELWLSSFRDTEGNLHCLMEERRTAR